ncbi:E3 ubiquitin-protein ligase RNF26-like [Salarias fasciatus]|uniref:E3 ubiquitin-protein ligase RNF26 n=1 Tax=Salarias fasciatus TaxID=181472 RepID=A0A672G5C2_SALFA|nr:E3 ubiquitin-protein ligase RNF26-like [Salarias fasciatus]
MEEVSVWSVAVGGCVDACFLLLDLLLRSLSWTLRLLSGVGGVLSGSSVVQSWNFAQLSFLTAAEAASDAARAVLQAAEGWLRALASVLESFKMAGHLCCHVAWRAKDVLQRSLISGSGVLRQACEGVGVALSLILYLINTAVNVFLIGVQNCTAAIASVWEAAAAPVHRALELALSALTFLYSSLVGAAVLLWASCQLLVDVLATVFTLDGLLAAAVASPPLLLVLWNPGISALARQLCLRPVEAVRAAARRLGTVVASPDAAHGADTSPRPDADGADTPPVIAPAQGDTGQDGETAAAGGETATGAAGGATTGAGGSGELLNLLQEQEEGKKCVVCQDESKTVLLLPCRHLCLCRHCADILSQRPASRCPLCRQHITQTMDVFL